MAKFKPKNPLIHLVEIMDTLREEGGCPWDREQTQESLKPYLIEETYEVLEAIDSQDPEKLKEELGDLLLQILFHARICKEKNLFDIYEVAKTIAKKLIRRHPHVFGDKKLKNSDEVIQNWEQTKVQERREKSKSGSVLSGVPKALPALLKAHRLQEKAARVGFDWEKPQDVLLKVEEELKELREKLDSNDLAGIKEEFGDLLFALTNLSRHLNINLEIALNEANQKFIERFNAVEQGAIQAGKRLEEMTLNEMDELWNSYKQLKGKGKIQT